MLPSCPLRFIVRSDCNRRNIVIVHNVVRFPDPFLRHSQTNQVFSMPAAPEKCRIIIAPDDPALCRLLQPIARMITLSGFMEKNRAFSMGTCPPGSSPHDGKTISTAYDNIRVYVFQGFLQSAGQVPGAAVLIRERRQGAQRHWARLPIPYPG